MNGRSNDGVIATGNAQVRNAVVASGSNARVDFRVTEREADDAADGRTLTPQEISDLLARFIEDLRRSDHPEREDLAEFAQDAREELAAPEPRTGKLRRVAKALVEAVPGFAALASLAVTIEEAVRGL
ncbi:hypothetical protein GCM10010503_15220 [Streptomyces lucensis JCM 4490]|uniref:Uncharacterized protein n=1 Tax=Streptomyces lucensis JCM 4490 TaxID=1306176 RepID=A0A918MNV6_9ACTN|nr:hypothetical protein [Streptomyces lucensis]GGW39796.1 hypothetical protein GCM10010503_15220 [Streptomyces lucensis JCM 4490]